VLGKRSPADSFAPAEMSGAVTVLPGVDLPGVAAIMVAPVAPVVEVTPWGIDAPTVSATASFRPPTTAPLVLSGGNVSASVATLPAPHSAPLMSRQLPAPMSAPFAAPTGAESTRATSRSRLYVLLGTMLVAAGGAAYYALEILPSAGS